MRRLLPLDKGILDDDDDAVRDDDDAVDDDDDVQDDDEEDDDDAVHDHDDDCDDDDDEDEDLCRSLPLDKGILAPHSIWCHKVLFLTNVREEDKKYSFHVLL